MRLTTALLLPGLLIACAQAPETIAASYVPERPFLSYTCEQLAEEQLRLAGALAQASQRQEQTRCNDIAGVLFLGMPMRTMSGGNMAPTIAHYRGTQEAMLRAGMRKGCGQVPALQAPRV